MREDNNGILEAIGAVAYNHLLTGIENHVMFGKMAIGSQDLELIDVY